MRRLYHTPLSIVAFLTASAAAACGGGTPDAADRIVVLVPFAAGERLTYGLYDSADVLVGRGELRVEASGDALALAQQYARPGEQPNDTSTVVVDATTLAPRSVERAISSEGHSYRATYAADGSSVALTRDDEKPRTLALPADAYDNESSLWLWRTIELRDGYRARYVSANPVERTRQVVSLTMAGRQRVEVPAGTFETWRLQVRNGRATRVAWIHVDPPHELVQWDNGTLLFKLEAAALAALPQAPAPRGARPGLLGHQQLAQRAVLGPGAREPLARECRVD